MREGRVQCKGKSIAERYGRWHIFFLSHLLGNINGHRPPEQMMEEAKRMETREAVEGLRGENERGSL